MADCTGGGADVGARHLCWIPVRRGRRPSSWRGCRRSRARHEASLGDMSRDQPTVSLEELTASRPGQRPRSSQLAVGLGCAPRDRRFIDGSRWRGFDSGAVVFGVGRPTESCVRRRRGCSKASLTRPSATKCKASLFSRLEEGGENTGPESQGMVAACRGRGRSG